MLNYYFSLHCIKILHKCSFSQLPLLHPSAASYPSPILSLIYPLSFLSLSDLAAPLSFCSFLYFLDLVTPISTSASYPCPILPLLHPPAASCPSSILSLLYPLELLILIRSCRSFILLQLLVLPRSCHSFILLHIVWPPAGSYPPSTFLSQSCCFSNFQFFPFVESHHSCSFSFHHLLLLFSPSPGPSLLAICCPSLLAIFLSSLYTIFWYFSFQRIMVPLHNLLSWSFSFPHLLALLLSLSPGPSLFTISWAFSFHHPIVLLFSPSPDPSPYTISWSFSFHDLLILLFSQCPPPSLHNLWFLLCIRVRPNGPFSDPPWLVITRSQMLCSLCFLVYQGWN